MLTATGVGSGLDIDSLVAQLVAAERLPTDSRLTRQEATLTAELSAFGSYKSALSAFQGSLANLNTLSGFGQRTASSSDASVITASASADATAASYDLTVTQLAKANSLASASYTSATDTVGTGTLTIRFGTTDYTGPDPGPESYNSFAVNADRGVATINVDATNNTLEGIRDAVNSADIGVSAAVVNDGSGYRLLFSSTQTGEENSLEISVDDTGDNDDINSAGLSALAFNSLATNLDQTIAAQDAQFTINGLAISSSGNTVSDAIDGVSLTLKDVSGAAPVSVVVAENTASFKQSIGAFVDGYNNFINLARGLTAYNADTGIAGALQGDFSARSMGSQLITTLTGQVAGLNGPFSSLSEIGITTRVDGQLLIDNTRLEAALADNYDQLVGLFTSIGFPDDSNVEFSSATDATVVGSYAVNISQLATQGTLQAAAIGFPVTIDSDNDSLTIKLDGISSGAIALTQRTYNSSSELAAEIQSRINGDTTLAAAGRSVSVVYNVDHFEITANGYGSESKVEITAIDTNTTAQLGFAVATGTDGVDVVGTIGGVAAVGIGQLLTGASGSNSEGLQLSIIDGIIGDRGNVEFSRGVAYQLNTLIGNFLDTDGTIDSRIEGLETRAGFISDQRAVLDRRMEALEARYFTQFNALDGLLSQLQGTSDFLTQQLDSLPGSGLLLGR